MSEPITYTSATARFALPFLFAAQVQKEAFVNEALARLDGLIHMAVEGEADTPPATPIDGEAWLIGPAPVEAWANHANQLALRQNGNWLFALPSDGMQIFDKSAQQIARFDGSWQRAGQVSAPSGGSTIDAEARTAIAEITAALVSAGILPPT